MGYYTGLGIVSGGRSNGSSAGSFTTHLGETVFLARRTNVKVTKYPGVAQPDPVTAAAYNMQAAVYRDYRIATGGGETWNTPHLIGDHDGTKTDYSYSQIGNSNLYELVKTEESVTTWINRNYRVI